MVEQGPCRLSSTCVLPRLAGLPRVRAPFFSFLENSHKVDVQQWDIRELAALPAVSFARYGRVEARHASRPRSRHPVAARARELLGRWGASPARRRWWRRDGH